MFRQVLTLALPIALLSCIGCTQVPDGLRTVPATGVVTLDGQPVEGATIVFIDDAGVNPARALSDEDGKFSLNRYEYKDGAVPGSYTVVVTKTVVKEVDPADMKGEEAEHAGEDAGGIVSNMLPKQYATPGNGLAFTIGEDGADNLNLELKSK